MKEHEEQNELDLILEESSLKEDSKNLRRKIDSICRTIENLSAKKLNIEAEIRTQKKVLVRKRNELKKRSKSNQTGIKIRLESSEISSPVPEEIKKIQQLDQRLLRESSRLLEE